MTTQHLDWQQINQCLLPVMGRETTRQAIHLRMVGAGIELEQRTADRMAEWADGNAARIRAEAEAEAVKWEQAAANFRARGGK